METVTPNPHRWVGARAALRSVYMVILDANIEFLAFGPRHDGDGETVAIEACRSRGTSVPPAITSRSTRCR